METTEHKILNKPLVTTNEVKSTTWKSSQDHAPSHTEFRDMLVQQDKFISEIETAVSVHQKDLMNIELDI